MDAGYAHVVEACYTIAHELGGEDGLFGYGNVAGAGGNYRDGAFAGDFAIALDDDYAGEFVESRGVMESFCGVNFLSARVIRIF